MSGNNYLFDTNAVLNFINNNKLIANLDAFIYISFITELELLSYRFLTQDENDKIINFLNDIEIIDIDIQIKKITIDLRKKYNLKLPDAIICATAYSNDLKLITQDKKLHSINEISSFFIDQIIQ